MSLSYQFVNNSDISENSVAAPCHRSLPIKVVTAHSVIKNFGKARGRGAEQKPWAAQGSKPVVDKQWSRSPGEAARCLPCTETIAASIPDQLFHWASTITQQAVVLATIHRISQQSAVIQKSTYNQNKVTLRKIM